MRSKRKHNKYPYIILGIIHLIMVCITFYKCEDRKKCFVLLLNYVGFAYLFEYIVVVLFDAYKYQPKFFAQKHKDNISGAIWSQFFYVPVTALFITAFQFGWKVKLLFGIYFTLLEKLFIHMGIFKNNWWRTRYTFLTIVTSFFVNDFWYRKLTNRSPVFLFISFFNMIQVTWMNIIFFLALLKQLRYGKPGNLRWENHFVISPLFGLTYSILLAWWTKDENLFYKIKSFLFMFGTDVFLLQKNMLKTQSILILPLIYFLLIGSANLYKRIVYRDREVYHT
ncbi:hypothetical protein IM538_08390 [Cytobacillus suaedae]|nr:hypothetical protein IM538_08390 [Cytobacillus suaedae]